MWIYVNYQYKTLIFKQIKHFQLVIFTSLYFSELWLLEIKLKKKEKKKKKKKKGSTPVKCLLCRYEL